jgi:SAM-dependent methyltransferase
VKRQLRAKVSAKEKEMAKILTREYRLDRLHAVIDMINPEASTILDLGCGIGSLTSLLPERVGPAYIVGLDRSKYLLSVLLNKRISPNTSVVLGDAPTFPLKASCFDIVVAVQVLHEVLYFKGRRELNSTIEGVYGLLRHGGEFIVLDHRNPGEAKISVHLSRELLEKLEHFRAMFKPREISYETLTGKWVRMSMRDFYDFVTKIWSIGTDLEEEEMNETHTPFTEKEFAVLCRKAGFRIDLVSTLTPIDSYLKHYQVDVKTHTKLPERHFLIRAKKQSLRPVEDT